MPASASSGFALFDTPIGPCGIAWGALGLKGVQLAEASAQRTRTRMRERFPGLAEAPPPTAVAAAIGRIEAMLRGTRDDLRDLVLDMTGISLFETRVYEVVRAIPPGETLTYGEIAARIGAPAAARAVGRAVGRNPFAPVVPCHRVLAAGGRLCGFSAHGGVATKLAMLRTEGARAAFAVR